MTLRDQRASTQGSAVELLGLRRSRQGTRGLATSRPREHRLVLLRGHDQDGRRRRRREPAGHGLRPGHPDPVLHQQQDRRLHDALPHPGQGVRPGATSPRWPWTCTAAAGRSTPSPTTTARRCSGTTPTCSRSHGVAPPDRPVDVRRLVEAARRLTVADAGAVGPDRTTAPPPAGACPATSAPGAARGSTRPRRRPRSPAPARSPPMQYWMDLFFKHKVNPVPGTFQAGRATSTLRGQGRHDLRRALDVPRLGAASSPSSRPSPTGPLGPGGKRVSASMGSGYPITTNSKYRDEAWLYESELLGKDPDRSVMGQFVKTGVGTPVRFSLMKEFEKSKFAPPNAQLVAPGGEVLHHRPADLADQGGAGHHLGGRDEAPVGPDDLGQGHAGHRGPAHGPGAGEEQGRVLDASAPRGRVARPPPPAPGRELPRRRTPTGTSIRGPSCWPRRAAASSPAARRPSR